MGGRKVYDAFMSYPLGADAHVEAYLLSRTLVFSLKYLQSFCISAFVE